MRQVSLPCETTLSERSIDCSVVGRDVEIERSNALRDRRAVAGDAAVASDGAVFRRGALARRRVVARGGPLVGRRRLGRPRHGTDPGRGHRLAEVRIASDLHAGGVGVGAAAGATGRIMRSHFRAGSCQRVSMFSARRASSSRPGNVTCFIASTTVLPSFVGWTVSTRLGAERGGDAPGAGLEAGVVAEQVDGHHAAGGENVEAGAVERGAVEDRARRLVVVEIDAQHVDRGAPARVVDEALRVHPEDLEAGRRRRQPEPLAADVDDARVELDRGASHLQPLAAEARDRAGAEAELDGVRAGPRGRRRAPASRPSSCARTRARSRADRRCASRPGPTACRDEGSELRPIRRSSLRADRRPRLQRMAVPRRAGRRGAAATRARSLSSRRRAPRPARRASAASSAPIRASSAGSLRIVAPAARASAVR